MKKLGLFNLQKTKTKQKYKKINFKRHKCRTIHSNIYKTRVKTKFRLGFVKLSHSQVK